MHAITTPLNDALIDAPSTTPMFTVTFAASAVPALNSSSGSSKQQAQQRVQQRHLDRVMLHQQREQQRAVQREQAAQQQAQQKQQQRELGVDAQEGRGARVKRPPKRDEPSPGEVAHEKGFLPCRMWTPEEDKRMVDCVRKFGLNWEKVAEQLPGRSAAAVRQHYVGDLLPQAQASNSSRRRPSPSPSPSPSRPSRATLHRSRREERGPRRRW